MQFPSQHPRFSPRPQSPSLQTVREDTLRQVHDRINARFDACRMRGTRRAWEYDPSWITAPRAADRAFMPDVAGYKIVESFATAQR